ncbi:MAG: hypothetical protein ABI622_08995 [Chloroflexota bacterium]
MSPRARAQGISWRLIGPAIAIWLFAVLAFATVVSPAAATNDAPERRASAAIVHASGAPSEAPILTILFAGIVVAVVVARPVRRVAARRRIR